MVEALVQDTKEEAEEDQNHAAELRWGGGLVTVTVWAAHFNLLLLFILFRMLTMLCRNIILFVYCCKA
jgi:hypothetical protein